MKSLSSGEFQREIRERGAMVADEVSELYISTMVFFKLKKLNRFIEQARTQGYKPCVRLLAHGAHSFPSKDPIMPTETEPRIPFNHFQDALARLADVKRRQGLLELEECMIFASIRPLLLSLSSNQPGVLPFERHSLIVKVTTKQTTTYDQNLIQSLASSAQWLQCLAFNSNKFQEMVARNPELAVQLKEAVVAPTIDPNKLKLEAVLMKEPKKTAPKAAKAKKQTEIVIPMAEIPSLLALAA